MPQACIAYPSGTIWRPALWSHCLESREFLRNSTAAGQSRARFQLNSPCSLCRLSLELYLSRRIRLECTRVSIGDLFPFGGKILVVGAVWKWRSYGNDNFGIA